jgi:two-component system, cell cycle response regulator DivK
MGKRVLVVEDDAQNSYLLRFLLEKSGYAVEVVTDGEQAVQAASREPRPDVILMDILLPKLNGYEATKCIKELPGVVGVPVIAITAYSMKGDRERILAAGCDGYIAKPIDPETFVEEMERFL